MKSLNLTLCALNACMHYADPLDTAMSRRMSLASLSSLPTTSCSSIVPQMYRSSTPLYHLSVLCEADILGLLAEALTADVQAILADETSLVGANTAVTQSAIIFACQMKAETL